MSNPQKQKRKTPSKAEFAKRLMAVQSWIIESVPPTVIIQQIILNEWAKSERHSYIIYAKAYKEWVKHETGSIEEKRRMAVQKLNKRISGMRNEYKGTPAGMNAILRYEKEINRLEGIGYLTHNPNGIEPDYTPPAPIAAQDDPSDIDYDLLSDEVLMAIASARKKTDD